MRKKLQNSKDYAESQEFLPALVQFITRVRKRAGQCNRVGVRVYICVYKKIVIERTRDLNYLKLVATDFFPKKISATTGENYSDSVEPLLFCSFCLVDAPLETNTSLLQYCRI